MKLYIRFLPLMLASFAAQGQIEFAETDFSYTASYGEEKVVAKFSFVNKGNETVEITRTQSSCGCTTAALAKKTYEPGESGEIEAVFTIGNRVGQQRKEVKVETSAGEHRLLINVQVPVPYEVAPRIAMWTRTGEPETRTVELKVMDPSVTGVEWTNSEEKWLNAELQESGNGSYTVQLTPTDLAAAPNRANGVLRLKREGKEDSLVSVYLRVN